MVRQSMVRLSPVIVEPEMILLSPQSYTPFVTGVVIQRQRIMKARPKFSEATLAKIRQFLFWVLEE